MSYGKNVGGAVPPPPGRIAGGVTGREGKAGGKGRTLPAKGGTTGRGRKGGGGGAHSQLSSASQ
ncbi:MAG: hypothetical protein IKZ37_07350 [Bacteroidaceae bacterium]|nr:hypothetical protein [Bacteroidaceae bacterium]